ncbi:MAG: solute carrier family 44 member 2 [Trebouxia sp. A1-2]|nr:MAG: solute carrier family 44 member 2 [Trebouxia sp. A1-2]
MMLLSTDLQVQIESELIAKLLFVLVLSTYRASPQWLQHPSNTARTLCGSNLGLAQAEGYLWWPDPDNTALSYCVGECPSAGYVCVNGTTYIASSDTDCTSLTSAYNSTDYLGYCLPSDTTSSAWTALRAAVNKPATLVRVMLGDSWRDWYLILACAAMAVAMSRFLMTMLSHDPALYLAVTIIGCVAFLALLGFIILFLGGVTHTAPTSLNGLSSIAGLRIFVFVLGIVFLGSAVAYGFYLLLQLGSGRLMLGIRLIRTANIALRDISYTGMLPVVTCGALFLLGMYAYVVGIYLHAMQVQNRALQGGLVFTRWLWFLGPVHGIGMIWTASFLLAVLRITTTTLVSTWYWTVDPKSDKMEALAVPTALQDSLVSHSGSLATASVLFTLAVPLQAVVAILPSSKCLPEGVKATCSHFSSDAYVQMAMHGYSLRKSFTTACQLLHRHKRRMRDCQGSACTAVLPGKVMVTAATSCAAVWLSQYCGAKHTFTVATVGVTTVAAYGIACAFLTMHEQAVEAMLQSFCEDCERNDGSAMHPYYMPPAFKKIILEAAKWQKTGSRLTGAITQIGHAVRHVVQKVQSIGSILSKLLTSVEQQSTALTLYPDPLSETRAVLERLGHKVAALETRLAETHLVFETKLQETDSDLSEMKEQILLGQAAYTFASLVEGFVSGGASTRDLQTLSLKEESTLTVA